MSSKNINNPLPSLYTALKANRIVTMVSLVASAIIAVSSLFFAYYAYSFSLDHIFFMNFNGEMVPAEVKSRSELAHISIKRHLALWFESYYTFDQDNLNQQREKGLWLISSEDGQRLESYYSQKYFPRVRTENIDQRAELLPSTVQINGNKEPYMFTASAKVKIRSANSSEWSYRVLYVRGYIIETQEWNYPKNPNGMLIVNYEELKLETIDKEQFLSLE